VIDSGGREWFNGWPQFLNPVGVKWVWGLSWAVDGARGPPTAMPSAPGGSPAGSTGGHCPPWPCCSGESEHAEPGQVHRGSQ